MFWGSGGGSTRRDDEFRAKMMQKTMERELALLATRAKKTRAQAMEALESGDEDSARVLCELHEQILTRRGDVLRQKCNIDKVTMMAASAVESTETASWLSGMVRGVRRTQQEASTSKNVETFDDAFQEMRALDGTLGRTLEASAAPNRRETAATANTMEELRQAVALRRGDALPSTGGKETKQTKIGH